MSSFTRNALLKRHMRIHSGMRPYQCQQCSSSFTHISNLHSHQKLHTEEKPFVCDICDSRFRQRSNLKSHQFIHTGERPYKCDTCNSSFVRRNHLKNHKRIHTNEKPYQCKECSAAFRQISNLKKHEDIHKRKKQLNLKLLRGFKLVKNDQYEQSNVSFACNQCDFKSYTRDIMMSHFISFHGDLHDNIKSSNTKPYKCDKCNSKFFQVGQLKSHKIIHTNEKPFKCKECPAAFKRKSNLKGHEHSHYRKKQVYLNIVRDCNLIKNGKFKQCKTTFLCTKCDFKSYTRNVVLTHFRSFHADLLVNKKSSNNNDAIFMCSVCEACFDSCENVKLHMKLHVESNLYTCPTCKESFVNVVEMLSHKETHSNFTDSIHLWTDFLNNNKLANITQSPIENVITTFRTHAPCHTLFIEVEKDDSETKDTEHIN